MKKPNAIASILTSFLDMSLLLIKVIIMFIIAVVVTNSPIIVVAITKNHWWLLLYIPLFAIAMAISDYLKK